MSAPKLILLADDLTGAADSAVPFASRGMSAEVVLDWREPTSAEIVAIDTETRSMPIQRAADLAFRLVERFAPIAPLFKKIDSTLRGYIGPECATALRAYRRHFPGASLLVAPAFPAMGRTTTDGLQLVNGKPIGSICAIIERAGLTTAIVSSPDSLPSGVDAWVCDASSDADLRGLLDEAQRCSTPPLLVGTGGLGRILAERFPLQNAESPPRIAGPILFVIGSAANISRAQVDALHEAVERATSDTVFQIAACHEAVICPVPGASRDLDPQISRKLATAIAPHLDRFAALFLTGGATARAVLDTMNIKSLRLVGELEPGVPVAVAPSGLVIATKAGGFGDAETLERCRRKLRS